MGQTQLAKDIAIKQQRFDYNKYLKGSEVPHAMNIKKGVLTSNMAPSGTQSALDYI